MALGVGSLSLIVGPALLGIIVLPYAFLKLIGALGSGFGLVRPADEFDLPHTPFESRRALPRPRRLSPSDLLVLLALTPVILYVVIMLL